LLFLQAVDRISLNQLSFISDVLMLMTMMMMLMMLYQAILVVRLMVMLTLTYSTVLLPSLLQFHRLYLQLLQRRAKSKFLRCFIRQFRLYLLTPFCLNRQVLVLNVG